VDDDPEPRLGRRPARASAERGHRRHRLRAARPRSRDGRAERVRSCSIERVAGPRRCARGRRGRGADGGRRRGTATSRPRTWPSPTASPRALALGWDPQTAGGLLVSLPPTAAGARRPSGMRAASSRCRIGRVEAASASRRLTGTTLEPCTSSPRASRGCALPSSRPPPSGGSRSCRSLPSG
jgi:hypothetical protein